MPYTWRSCATSDLTRDASESCTKAAAVSGFVPSSATVAACFEARDGSDVEPVAAHASYLINLAAVDAAVLAKSVIALRDEIARCVQLDLPYLVMHPGSHLGAGMTEGIARVAENLVPLLDEIPDGARLRVALENVAGQGTNIGASHCELRDLLDAIDRPARVAICFDTCHAFAAGYELRDQAGYDETFADFDAVVGLEQLALFHLNDSKKPFASRRDRHERIGEGEIGPEAFARLVNDARFVDHPGILETPAMPDGTPSYAHCLRVLRGLVHPA